MGAQTSNLSLRIRELMGQKARRYLLLGLDSAGKTTLLYSFKLGEVVATIPTIGFNVESVDFVARGQTMTFTALDFGGRTNIRALWRHFYEGSSAIIFVLDSNDRDRVEQAKDEVKRLCSEDVLAGVPLLVFANKQDLPGAMSKSEVIEQLGLGAVHNRHWMVQESVVTEGVGVKEGMDWLTWALDPKTKLPMQSKSLDRAQPADKQASESDKVSFVPTGDEPIMHVNI